MYNKYRKYNKHGYCVFCSAPEKMAENILILILQKQQYDAWI